MEQYLDLVETVLREGTYKPNRTGVDTIAAFSQHYEIDLQKGYPLLTTKRMDDARWNSMIHELLWYLSGEEHIRNLREHTGIWNAWADEAGTLDTAYGRFWRRFPIPESGLDGETWTDDAHRWVNDDERTFDQIRYVLDTLREDPNSRRMIVDAWHPANATISTLPPCHYTFVVSVQDDALNLHLTQRSGDIALGIPFNIAAYSLLATIFAQRTGFDVGSFAHTIVDAHVYCGNGARGSWYADALAEFQGRLAACESRAEYARVQAWIEDEAPAAEGYDHVPNLLEQLTREPLSRPTIEVADVPIDDLAFEDIQLQNYDSHPKLGFKVAE